MTYENPPKGSYTHWKGDCGREASPDDVERALALLVRPGQPRFELTERHSNGKPIATYELSLPQVLWAIERAHRVRYSPQPEPGATLRMIPPGEDPQTLHMQAG